METQNNDNNFSSHKIGMGEPVAEEVDKIRNTWEKFKNFAKTPKFKILAGIGVLIIILIIVIAVIAQIPANPKPPAPPLTPTPIASPTESPSINPQPISSESATLAKELHGLLFNNPDLSFPLLDWKISLTSK